jgi:hypothetical protein
VGPMRSKFFFNECFGTQTGGGSRARWHRSRLASHLLGTGSQELRAISCFVVESRLGDVPAGSRKARCAGRTGDTHHVVEEACSSRMVRVVLESRASETIRLLRWLPPLPWTNGQGMKVGKWNSGGIFVNLTLRIDGRVGMRRPLMRGWLCVETRCRNSTICSGTLDRGTGGVTFKIHVYTRQCTISVIGEDLTRSSEA